MYVVVNNLDVTRIINLKIKMFVVMITFQKILCLFILNEVKLNCTNFKLIKV